jgi:hypothetical protein
VRTWQPREAVPRSQNSPRSPSPVADTVTELDDSSEPFAVFDREQSSFTLFHQGGTLWQLTPTVNPRWLKMFLQAWFIEGKTMPIEPTMDDETGIYE